MKGGCAWKMRERGGRNWKGWTLRQKMKNEFTPSNRNQICIMYIRTHAFVCIISGQGTPKKLNENPEAR